MRNAIALREGRQLEAMSLEELFDEAARYGNVDVFSSDRAQHPNCYKVNITFQTRAHTEMKASSEYKMPVKGALIQAISNAEDMVQVARGIR